MLHHISSTDMAVAVCTAISIGACASVLIGHLCVFVCSVFLVFPLPEGSGVAGVGSPLCFSS